MASSKYRHSLETRYKGVQFKSRLEARYALMLDALGIAWDYEPETFKLEAGGYVPDFRLSWACGHALWAEVKPTLDVVTPRDWARYHDFSRNRVLLLLVGLPAARPHPKASAMSEPGGVILMPTGPQYSLDPNGAPFDLSEVEAACKMARDVKFLKRKG